MAETEMVRVEVLRPYPRGGKTHKPGATISIPEHALADATRRNPPHVRVVGAPEVEIDADFDATEGALDLARATGIDLAAFAGQGSGENGRIEKPDVKKWAKERGLIPEDG